MAEEQAGGGDFKGSGDFVAPDPPAAKVWAIASLDNRKIASLAAAMEALLLHARGSVPPEPPLLDFFQKTLKSKHMRGLLPTGEAARDAK